MPWQWKDVILPGYGTKREDGRRQFRELDLAIPRKNGKSPLAAGLGLYHLFADGESYPEVVCAAGSAKQAKEVYDYARFFIASCPALARRCVVKSDEIVRHDGGKLRLLAADGKLQHGQHLSAVIMDELHVWPNRDLYDALNTGVAGRRQPMRILISTAGSDRESLWYSKYAHAKAVMESRRSGNEIDPYLWAAIYESPADMDWRKESTWKHANPNYGVSVYKEYFEELVVKSEASNAELSSFQRYNLNVWTDASSPWLNMDRWDACAVPRNEWPDLSGRTCFAALDLSSTLDLSALVLAFPVDDKIYLVPHAWTTAYAIKERERRNKIRFDKWGAAGHLTVIPGEVIEYELIKKHIKEIATKYRIKELALDRWGAAQFIQDMQGEGLEVVGFGQGFAGISAATKAFESAVIGGKVVHDGHPVLRWCVGNTVIDQDPAGNCKPSKGKSTEKIDLCVASIMALARAQLGGSKGTSIYETRGLAAL